MFVDLHLTPPALGLVPCVERKGRRQLEERRTKGDSLRSFRLFFFFFCELIPAQIPQSCTRRLNNRTQCPLPLPFSPTLAVSCDGLAHQLGIIRMSCSLVRPAGPMQHRWRKSTFQGRTPSRAPLLSFFCPLQFFLQDGEGLHHPTLLQPDICRGPDR